MTSWAVVEAVGARLCGQASSRIVHGDDDVRSLAERRVPPSRHRDERRAAALHVRDQRDDLLGLARVREREDDVAAEDHPEVAVDRLGRVQEEGGRAGRGERRGDLLADDAALADARHDDAPGGGLHGGDGAVESLVEAVRERADGLRLDLDDAAGLLAGGGRHAGRVYLPLPRSTVRAPVAGSRRTRRPSASRKRRATGDPASAGGRTGVSHQPMRFAGTRPAPSRGDRAGRRVHEGELRARAASVGHSFEGNERDGGAAGGDLASENDVRRRAEVDRARGAAQLFSPSKKTTRAVASGDAGDGDPVARKEPRLRALQIRRERSRRGRRSGRRGA